MQTASHAPRVLVVDDDPGVLHSLKLLLEDDCDVTCVDSPKTALTLATSQPFDVIVTDFKMPHMTGGEFAHAVKEQVKPAPYILMLTGTPQSVTHTTPGGQDLVMVLAKPFEPDRLLRMVTQVGRLGLIRRGVVAAN
ncbi:MAG: response regulator [Myxococcaceae bacterium]|jgi:CheY-like chemotaxis protein|nr:response regulator [Myxococcaceae bacterium]